MKYLFNHDEIMVHYNGILDFSSHNYAIIETKFGQKKNKRNDSTIKKENLSQRKYQIKKYYLLGLLIQTI